jgi:hypothetical protein
MQENVVHYHMCITMDISQQLQKNIVFKTQNYNLRTYDRESVFLITRAPAEENKRTKEEIKLNLMFEIMNQHYQA